MGLNIGNTTIGEIYLGNTKIAEAYLGSSKIYSSAAPVPTDEVQIGNQIWKTKNLAITDGGSGIYTQTVNYGQGDVVEYYYTWTAARRIANSIVGWHLPTKDEWDSLCISVGTKFLTKLKSTYGWQSVNGTDDYGFAMFPAGYRYSGFSDLGISANFWTATEKSSNYAYYEYFYSSSQVTTRNKSYCLSVRLVKDAT